MHTHTTHVRTHTLYMHTHTYEHACTNTHTQRTLLQPLNLIDGARILYDKSNDKSNDKSVDRARILNDMRVKQQTVLGFRV